MPLDSTDRALIGALRKALRRPETGRVVMAFDRSGRSYDRFNRLRVEKSNITKANVCEYYGWEIPGWEDLRLDPDRKYRLWRHPDELAKGAATFNGLPILGRHIPHSANLPRKEDTVGSAGTDARYEHPYLTNSLIFWDGDAIEDIESKDREQLSSAYAYKPDMTSGVTPDGERYDGIMRDIVGNHIAQIPEGRVGDDVVVGDEKPRERTMPKRTRQQFSRKALLLHGAIAAYTAPKLAADAKLPDLRKLLAGVTAKNWPERRPKFAAAFAEAIKPSLAQDATVDDLVDVLCQLDDDTGLPMAEVEDQPPPPNGDPDPEPDRTEAPTLMDKIMEFLATKLSDEDMAKLKAMAQQGEGGAPGATDADETDEERKAREAKFKGKGAEDKQAMDEALKKVRAETEAAVIKRMRDLRDAENFARPWIGDLVMAQDSATDVYKIALDTLGVKVGEDVHPSAYRHILQAQPKPADKQRAQERSSLAMDAKQETDFATMFPAAGRLRRA